MTEEQAAELATRLTISLLEKGGLLSPLLPSIAHTPDDVAKPIAAVVLAIQARLLAGPQ